MEFSDRTTANKGEARLWETGRHSIVQFPTPYQGIGDALRVAYAPKSMPLPADIAALLEQLQ